MNGNDDYMEYILEKFSGLEVVSAKKMFGGYVLHMAGKVLGFIFEGEFLFEPGPTVDRLLPDAERKELFPGSKLFVVIEESMSSQQLCHLAQECYDDLPLPKPRKKKRVQDAGKSVEKRFPFAKNIE